LENYIKNFILLEEMQKRYVVKKLHKKCKLRCKQVCHRDGVKLNKKQTKKHLQKHKQLIKVYRKFSKKLYKAQQAYMNYPSKITKNKLRIIKKEIKKVKKNGN